MFGKEIEIRIFDPSSIRREAAGPIGAFNDKNKDMFQDVVDLLEREVEKDT